MELEILDLTASCRLCLASTSNESSDELESEELIDKLIFVFHKSFTMNEWFPKIICHSCTVLVTEMYTFMLKVQRNQDYLDSLGLPVKCEVTLENNDQEFESQSEDPSPVDKESVELQFDTTGHLTDTETVDVAEAKDLSKHENHCSSEADEKSRDQADTGKEDVLETEVVDNCLELEENCPRGDSENLENEVVTKEKCSSKNKQPPKKKSISNQHNRDREEEMIKQYYKFKCELCSVDASDFRELLNHFRDSHRVSGYIKCCNKKLYRRCRLLEHISMHLNPDTFRCELCNKNYACKTSLELHNMHQHLSEDKKSFRCTKCPKAFAKDYQLTCHMVRHVAAECPECGKIMSSKLSLKEHLVKMHGESGQHRLVCDTCGKEFRSKPSFERHVLLHQGVVRNKRHQCHLCQRWLVDKMGLNKHFRTQHKEANGSFICGVCGKTAPNSAALLQHQRIVHAEEKFGCEICGKKFKRAIALKEHRATHTGEALYSCKFCPMTFISNANMYTHQKKIHPSEWEQSRKSKSD